MEKTNQSISELEQETQEESPINQEAVVDNSEDISNESITDLRKFSKRYSIAARQQLANHIRELRFQHFKKQKRNPELLDSVEENKIEVENLRKEQESIESEIEALQKEVEIHKAKLWSKIQEFFRKVQLEQELEIDVKKKKIEQIKEDIEIRLKIIAETQDVILDKSSLDDAKKELSDFYAEQSDLKSKFESETQERDVETISREKGYIFFHGVPTKNRTMKNTAENNPLLKTGVMTTEDKLSLLMGIEPTISASTLKRGEKDAKTFYTFGVILGGVQY